MPRSGKVLKAPKVVVWLIRKEAIMDVITVSSGDDPITRLGSFIKPIFFLKKKVVIDFFRVLSVTKNYIFKLRFLGPNLKTSFLLCNKNNKKF